MKLAKDVDNELKTVVIQAVEVKPGVFGKEYNLSFVIDNTNC